MRYCLKLARIIGCLLAIGILVIFTPGVKYADAAGKLSRSKKFAFDGSISREVLENYLDRSATMGYFLVNGKPEGYEFPYREDDIRMIKNIGVKFIGRAIYRWGQESWLNNPGFLNYARVHARRHYVLLDGHVPSGGFLRNGVSLLDFNSFPMRIKEVVEKPYEGKLQVGYLDAIFRKSKGGIAPSGWKCESLPYLVEFDNYGKGRNPNVADTTSIFVWGWDEISWFAQQPEEYRNNWLVYAHDWIKKTDPNGHLQMPITRMITCPNQTLRSYFANTKSESCPVGYSQEETIKKIWNRQDKKIKH